MTETATTISDRSPASVRTRLSEIDWSFERRARAPQVEAIHPYPAKFVGDLPRALIQALPPPLGTAVFDPFVGSGTTLLEAQRFGVPSIGVDLNPIGCLIARVKTSPTPGDINHAANRVTEAAMRRKHPRKWAIPNIDHWFKQDVQHAVSALIEEIDGYQSGGMYDAMRVALSSVLVRVSNQDSDTRYAAVDKGVTDVYRSFLGAAAKLQKALDARDWKLTEVRVITANTLTLDPNEITQKVGLVITSPPYPNAYEYWLYHKYRMWWLGFDPLSVKEQEIGARAHFFKRDHHTGDQFWCQMRTTMALIDRVLIREGYACFVIGRSIIHGQVVNNAAIIESVAVECGYCTVAKFERSIAANRKSFNLSHANIKTETVLILGRSPN